MPQLERLSLKTKNRALLRGLTPDFKLIAQVIRAMNKDTTEAVGMLITHEMSLHDNNGTGDEVETSMDFSATQEKEIKCFHCGRQGHVKLDCFYNPESSKYRSATNSRWVGRSHSGSGNGNKSASQTGPGYITFFSKCLTSPMKVSKIKNKWFIDSGPNSHMTNSKILFSKPSNQDNFPTVSVGNGY